MLICIIIDPPSVISTSDTNIMVNTDGTSTVSFMCTVVSKPDATVDWYHGSIKMVYSNRVIHNVMSHDTYSDTQTHTLTLTEVSHSDEGQYYCNASNNIINITYNDSAVFTLLISTGDSTGDTTTISGNIICTVDAVYEYMSYLYNGCG